MRTTTTLIVAGIALTAAVTFACVTVSVAAPAPQAQVEQETKKDTSTMREVPPPMAAQQRPPAPKITVNPPTDPSGPLAGFLACNRGNKQGCAITGAWLAAHAQAGRKLSLCLHAGDISDCTEITATWPE